MAATYSSKTTTADGGSYTPDAGTDTLLVWIDAMYTSGAPTASGQTYDGNAMVEDHDITTNLAGGGDPACSLAHYVNPGTSSAVLGITWSLTPSAENGVAITLAGVDQTTPVYTTNVDPPAAYTTDLSPSLSYDAPDDSVIIYWKLHRQTGTPSNSLPANFTERENFALITSPADISLTVWTRDLASAVTGASVSSTANASVGGVHGVIVFQPAAGGGPTTTPKSATYSPVGAASLSVAVTYANSANYDAVATESVIKLIQKTLGLNASASASIIKQTNKTLAVASTGTVTEEHGLVTPQAASFSALGTLSLVTVYIARIGGAAIRALKRISIRLGLGL